MSVVGAPPEAAPAAAAPEVAPSADPAQGAPPTPDAAAPAAPPEGDAAPGAEGEPSDYEPTADELAIAAKVARSKVGSSIVDEVAAERADAIVAEKEKDLEARVRTRAAEAETGETSRLALYDTAEQQSRTRAQELVQLVNTGQFPQTVDELAQYVDPIIAGATAITARKNEATIGKLAELLPEPTKEELAALEDPLFQHRKAGVVQDAVLGYVNAIVARKDTEIADLKKQLRDRDGTKAAAERLAAAAEAAGPGVGAAAPAGRAADTGGGPLTLESASTLPVSELQARRARERSGR